MLRNVPGIMGASPWWVLLEKKHWLKMGKKVHSNIKYLCVLGAVGIAWARFQLVDSISGLKSGRGISHHLKWQAINRHVSQMFLP